MQANQIKKIRDVFSKCRENISYHITTTTVHIFDSDNDSSVLEFDDANQLAWCLRKNTISVKNTAYMAPFELIAVDYDDIANIRVYVDAKEAKKAIADMGIGEEDYKKITATQDHMPSGFVRNPKTGEFIVEELNHPILGNFTSTTLDKATGKDTDSSGSNG